jgi:hypothetical protein
LEYLEGGLHVLVGYKQLHAGRSALHRRAYAYDHRGHARGIQRDFGEMGFEAVP